MVAEKLKGTVIDHWTWDSLPLAHQKFLEQQGIVRVCRHRPLKKEAVTIFATMSPGGNRLRSEFLRAHPGESYSNQHVYVHATADAGAHIERVKDCAKHVMDSIGDDPRPVDEVKSIEDSLRFIRQFTCDAFVCAINTDKTPLFVFHEGVDVLEITCVADHDIREMCKKIESFPTMTALHDIIELADVFAAEEGDDE